MVDTRWEVVQIVYGELEAQMVKSWLEANDISVILSEEGVARAIGLYSTSLAAVQILVPASSKTIAQEVLSINDSLHGIAQDPDDNE